jgi:hypothetical protein
MFRRFRIKTAPVVVDSWSQFFVVEFETHPRLDRLNMLAAFDLLLGDIAKLRGEYLNVSFRLRMHGKSWTTFGRRITGVNHTIHWLV